MSDARVAIYDVRGPATLLDDVPERTGDGLRKVAAGRGHVPFDTADNPLLSETFSGKNANGRVEEDRGFYVPDFLTDERYDANPAAHSAAADHAKHLYKAERVLDEALNLVKLMLAALGDVGDSRAMQNQIGLKVIEKKLAKAHTQIDKHDTRHTNLFLAYFDLKDSVDRGAG